MVEELNLEYSTKEFKGLQGKIKTESQYFKVMEIPLYEPTGQGPHLYIKIKKENLSTLEVIEILAKTYNLNKKDIGYAGLKDKKAITVQTISLNNLSKEKFLEKQDELNFEILDINYHKNKLKIGHLLGNNFEIILETENKDYNLALQIAKKITENGLANFFGEQRFGHNNYNVQQALKILERPYKKDAFLLSALQAYVFNFYLNERLKQGLFNKILLGDLCKKHETGGIFIAEDVTIEQQRYNNFEISSAGPIFGPKMPPVQNEALAFENEILNKLNIKNLLSCGQGTRRFNRILIPNLTVQEHSLGFLFNFTLPKGSYATVVLREFIK